MSCQEKYGKKACNIWGGCTLQLWLVEFCFVYCYFLTQAYLDVGPLTQWWKKSNSRKIYLKFKDFSSETKKYSIFGPTFKQLKIWPKNAIFNRKFENFLKIQGFLQNSSSKSLKNSRNRQIHKSYRAQKTAKKITLN